MKSNIKATELISRRTERGKVFAFLQGGYQYISYSQQVHYKKASGAWREIDNNLLKEGNSYTVKENPASFSFGTENAANVMRVEKNGRSIAWYPMGGQAALSPIVINGSELRAEWEKEQERTEQDRRENLLEKASRIVYKGILPGVDIAYDLCGMGAQETVTAENAESLMRVGKSFTLGEGLSFTVKEGAVKITDEKTGERVFRIGASYLRDSKGECEYALKPVVQKTEAGFTLDYDFTDIDTESLSYPVTIDPEYQCDRDNTAIKDTTIKQASPNTNYGSSDQGETGILSGNENRFLIRIASLPAIPAGEAVVSSVLKIAGNASDYADPKYISAHEMTGTWA